MRTPTRPSTALTLVGVLLAGVTGTGCVESQGRGALIGAAVGAGVGFVIASESHRHRSDDHRSRPAYRPAYEDHRGHARHDRRRYNVRRDRYCN